MSKDKTTKSQEERVKEFNEGLKALVEKTQINARPVIGRYGAEFELMDLLAKPEDK